MNPGWTRHALVRCQQRGIPPHAVDWVLKHGRCLHDHRGGEIWFLDKRGRQAIARELRNPADRQAAEKLDTYVVLVDGRAVTVGHRHKRITRS